MEHSMMIMRLSYEFSACVYLPLDSAVAGDSAHRVVRSRASY